MASCRHFPVHHRLGVLQTDGVVCRGPNPGLADCAPASRPRRHSGLASRPLRRAIVIGCLLVAIGGCSFEYEVVAQINAGKVQFFSKSDGGWFRPNACIDNFEVVANGVVQWAIRRKSRHEPCRSDFPVTYGDVPQGFTELTPPSRLSSGMKYEIRGYGRVMYRGGFGLPPGNQENSRAPRSAGFTRSPAPRRLIERRRTPPPELRRRA